MILRSVSKIQQNFSECHLVGNTFLVFCLFFLTFSFCRVLQVFFSVDMHCNLAIWLLPPDSFDSFQFPLFPPYPELRPSTTDSRIQSIRESAALPAGARLYGPAHYPATTHPSNNYQCKIVAPKLTQDMCNVLS